MNVHAEKKNLRKRALSLLLALSSLCSLACAVPAAAAESAGAAVSKQTWADDEPVLSAVEQLAGLDIIRGDPDGGLHPERTLRRSEFAAMVNRAYGFTKTGSTPFTDVKPSAWYANDIGIAYNAGYYQGTAPTLASPQTNLTREQTMVLLARNMRLEEAPGQVEELSDGDSVSAWARGYVRAAAQAGLIDDDSGNGFRPRQAITRGEMAQLLLRCVGTPVRESGEQSLGSVYGNVTISAPGAVLRDTTVAGDLYISGGVGSKGVTLENVNVLGRIVVAGGGEAESGTDSVILRNVEAEELVLDNLTGQYLSLRAEGDTSIPESTFRTGAFILDRTEDNYGLLNLALDADDGASFTLSGNIKNATNLTPGSTLTVASATVNDLVIDEDAVGSTLNIARDAVVKQLGLDTGVPVTGAGDIENIQINTLGTTTEQLPDKISIRPGLTATVAGTEMDAATAKDTSTDPRLLAGYPKVNKLASTSATAVFSANKAGTVYWAVSAIADGSISESDLIDPGEYTNRAIVQDKLQITEANKEFTAAIKDLTRDGRYYLSAVFVDARGVHSPLKVVSFTTPDDTVPAFLTGYPKILKTSINPGAAKESSTQAMVMTNKTCQLYYALFPAGSATPTANDFKTGALAGNLGSGNLAITRNEETKIFHINSKKLEEKKNYDLYFWLTDIDGAKSSAVTKLTFTTNDETPPEFTMPMQTNGSATTTSIPLTTAVNEAATVYWVAVPDGYDYLVKQKADESDEAYLLRKQIQIATGSGNPLNKNGSVRATDNNLTVKFNVTGLEAETAYDIYYVAMDTAGNYSLIPTPPFTVSTLDNIPPTATIEFTSFEIGHPDRPHANTAIRLIFSERIMQQSTSDSIIQLYQNVLDAAGDEAKLKAKNALANALRKCMTLQERGLLGFEDVSYNKPYLPTAPSAADEKDMVIDYREAVVTRGVGENSKQLIVTFYSDEVAATDKEVGHGRALHLKTGSTYRFHLSSPDDGGAISDMIGNVMGECYLPSSDGFATISAQVLLQDANYTLIDVSDGLGSTKKVVSDVSFKMLPQATDLTDPTKAWDLLIWSDISVQFDLYYRISKDFGSTEAPNFHANSAGDTVWKKAGDTITITKNGNAEMYGKSLFSNILSFSGDPSNANDRPLLTNLTENETYEFAIHIVQHDRIPEGTDGENRNQWGKNVRFKFNVVSGSNSLLRTMTSNVDGNYASAISSRTVEDNGVPNPFILTAVFSDTSAPTITLDRGYPTFAAEDTYVDITVTLSRQGTLYYVIAPAYKIPTDVFTSSLHTTTTQIIAPTKDSDGKEIDGTGNVTTLVPEDGKDTSPAAPVHVDLPNYLDIVDVNFGDDKEIKTGNLVRDTVARSFRVGSVEDPLLANTTYIAYFVVQGNGPYYSEHVEVYTFKTKPMRRPVLTLEWKVATETEEGGVNITSDPTSLVNYMLMVYDTKSLDRSLSVPFGSCIDDDVLTEKGVSRADINKFLSDRNTGFTLGKNLDSTPDYSDGLTCLQAMSVPYGDGNYSLFDVFANFNSKEAVRAYVIRKTSPDQNAPIVDTDTVLSNTIKFVPCDNAMQPYNNYAFLAVGRSTQGAEASEFTYVALYPLHKSNAKAPRVTASVSSTLNTAGTYLNCEIMVHFDSPLYFLDNGTRIPVVDAGISLADGKNAVSIASVLQWNPSSQVSYKPRIATKPDSWTAGQTFNFNVNYYVADGRSGPQTVTFTSEAALCNADRVTHDFTEPSLEIKVVITPTTTTTVDSSGNRVTKVTGATYTTTVTPASWRG